MVFDLNGHTYTLTGGTGSQGTETSGFQIRPEVTETATIKNGTIKIAEGVNICWMFNNYATNFIVEDVTVDCTNMAWSYGESCYIHVSRSGDNTNFTGKTNFIGFNSGVAGAAINVGGTMTIADTVNIGNLAVDLDVDATLTAPEGLNVTTTVDGYEVVYENGTYSLVETAKVAEVNGVQYATLQAAINDAQAGDTVTLLINATEEEITVVDGKNFVLDLNTYTLTLPRLMINKGATIEIKNGSIVGNTTGKDAVRSAGNLTLTNVNVTGLRHTVRITEGTAVINGGTYKYGGTTTVYSTYHIINIGDDNTGATVTIKDGTFIAGKGIVYDGSNAVQVQGTSNVTIEGGNFSNSNLKLVDAPSTATLSITGGTFDQDPTAYVADGYEAVETNGTWTVQEKVVAPAVTIAHYGQNLRLQDLIKIGYYFSVTTDAEIAEVGALLWTAEQYASETDFTVNSTIARKYQNLKASSGYYSIETDGIYAQNLDQVYYMIPYVVTSDGNTHYGTAMDYSALDYIGKAYTSDAASADLKSIVIDLANYATAARAYFCITEGLEMPTVPLNSMLNDADKVVNYTDSLKVDYPAVNETGNYAVNVYGKNVNLLDAISIGIYYTNASDMAGAYYWNAADYSNNASHTSATKTGDTVNETATSYTKANVTGLYAFNIYDNYYVRAFNNEGELSDTIGVSVAAYLTQVINAYVDKTDAESVAVVELAKAMLVYGNNAETNSEINK